MDKKHTKCTRRRFCDLLYERMNETANHGKGLTMLWVTNLRTNKGRVLGVMYKRSEKDRGLMVTFCPWCGTNILELFKISGVGNKGSTQDGTYAP